jgi:hypothetical protein
MSTTIGKYVKVPSERKRYQIDYTDWLDTGEAVLNVVFVVTNNDITNPVVVDGVQVLPTGLGVQYYMSGGNAVKTYKIDAVLTTTTGPQVRQDEILLTVKAP